jgi:hypothetical protein
MTDLDGTGDGLRVDRLIDQAIARRAAANGATGPPDGAETAGRAGPDGPGPEEALIAELSWLRPVDWPADEADDRIAAAVTAATATTPDQPTGPRPDHDRPAAVGYLRTPRRRRWLALGAAAVALLVAAVFQLTGSPHPTAGPGPAGSRTSQSPRATAPATQTQHPARTWLTAMRVVARTAALRAVGAVNIDDNFLTCVSRSVCYVQGSSDGGKLDDIARSVDGGATWSAGETLPAGGPEEFTAQVSCPHPLTCFAPYGASLLETTDGFAHYVVLPVDLPSLTQVGVVSCPTTLDCVAVVRLSDGRQTFAYSHDGGGSWTEGRARTLSSGDIVAALRCDRDGACIAALIIGTEATPLVGAVSSTDGGLSWTRSRSYSIVDMQQYMVSCVNGQNCLIGSNDGYLAWVHAATSGHVGIRVQPFPKSWDALGDAVACASGPDCFVATSSPQLEATRNAGHTWTLAPAAPITQAGNTSDDGLLPDSIVYLSCPVRAGCVALANDGSGDQSSWVVLSNLTPKESS